MRKRSMTLIEIFLAFILFSILLTSLFFSYHYATRSKAKLHKLKSPLQEERYASQRLQKILPKATHFTSTREGKNLSFRFDRGIWKDPLLSEEVLATIFLDENSGQLTLSIWPCEGGEPLTEPSQTIPLLDHVTHLFWEYYSPPNPAKPVDPKQVGDLSPQQGWQPTWSARYSHLPSLIKLEITREPMGEFTDERTLSYLFATNEPILYTKELP
ncbi:MAG: hypothetical protein K940chlam9_00707 [Chlamydiae bacterium]|nr:hypothetical protein [Chlamydiota bacterium]